MRLKPGVRFGSADVAIMVAMMVVQSVYDSHKIEFVITSFNDGTHMANSLHYTNQAFDVRTKNILSMDIKLQIHKEIRERITRDYDVLLEGIGKINEHLHIEYQRK